MDKISRYLIPAGAVACLWPGMPSAGALVLGILITLLFENPYVHFTKKYTSKLLTWSVIGLGAGMDLLVVGRVGLNGIGYTIIGISFSMLIGTILGKLLKTNQDVSLLVTSGTAICGGSAIAAVAPTIQAKDHDVSVALGTIFLLNAVALIVFPLIGHHFSLTQTQFGLWAALAIHDTSSVVGATLQYGKEALEVGTTVKLARALWIVPLTLAIGFYYSHTDSKKVGSQSTKKPWFILGFLLMAALVTFIPDLKSTGHIIESVAKRTLVLTLFFIGTNLSRQTLKMVGIRPLLQGILLWVIIASSTLSAVYMGWIH